LNRAAWALGFAASLGCGSAATPAREPPPAAPATEEKAEPSSEPPSGARRGEEDLIALVLSRVQAARGLQARHPVPGRVMAREALIERVKEHLHREVPLEAILDEGLGLQLLGFVSPRLDYEAAELGLLQAQLAGYYEPADGTMYMAADLGHDEATATLAHELVHALQDQHWGLEERSKYRPGHGDSSEAFSALAEGDATSAMFDVMAAMLAPGSGKTALDVPDDVIVASVREGIGAASAGAPREMLTSLAAAYVYGTLFVNALRRRGGWQAVDLAWADPPTTSEQILHVDKWVTHEGPMPVPAPGRAALGAGWTVADDDSEGEIGTRVAFEEWMNPRTAAELSAGWGGDRVMLLKNGSRAALAWRLRYDPGGDHAARAFVAVAGGLGVKSSSEPWACVQRPDRGPIAVARAGDDLLLLAGPADTRPSGWTSAGDCALARAWAREVLSAR
jgi:hypothetical protein